MGDVLVRHSALHTVGAPGTSVFRALGSTVTISLWEASAGAAPAVESVIAMFAELQATCTRFDQASPLMRANAAPDEWHHLPPIAIDVLRCAYEAHRVTGGLFDPRVHDALVAYGYAADRGNPTATSASAARVFPLPVSAPLDQPWEPVIDADRVHLGGSCIDLGGIGKGYAVRRALEMLRECACGVLINAGGDVGMCGTGPYDGHWHVGVEDPFGADQPRAVLQVAAGGVATSSVRVHRWQTERGVAHHIIDPRTGAPAISALRSVTVVDDDPMWAEVWSKVLFVIGADRIAESAEHEGRAVFWIDEANRFRSNPVGVQHELWVRDVA